MLVQIEQIRCVNFKATQVFEDLAYKVFQDISSKAPMYSEVRMRFEKINGVYVGYGTVFTQEKALVGYANSSNIYEVLKNVQGQLLEEISIDRKIHKVFEYKKAG